MAEKRKTSSTGAQKKTTKTTKNTKTQKKETEYRQQELKFRLEMEEAQRKEVSLWIIIACAFILELSNFGLAGFIGNGIGDFMRGILGWMAYLTPIIWVLSAAATFFEFGNILGGRKLAGFMLLILFVSMGLTLLTYKSAVPDPVIAYKNASSSESLGGGFMGALLAWLLVKGFGVWGAAIINIIVLIISAIFITGQSVISTITSGSEKLDSMKKEGKDHNSNTDLDLDDFDEKDDDKILSTAKNSRRDKKHSGVSLDTLLSDKESESLEAPAGKVEAETYPPLIDEVKEPERKKTIVKPQDNKEEYPVVPSVTGTPANNRRKRKASDDDDMALVLTSLDLKGDAGFADADFLPKSEDIIAQAGIDELDVPKTRKGRISKEESARNLEETNAEINAHAAESIEKSYIFPSLNLLKPGSGSSNNSERYARATQAKLEETLQNFGVEAEVVGYSCGPSVTRFEIQPAAGVKVSRIVNLTDDIKLSLAAADIRIEAPIPGKSAIGIEVPNKSSSMVSFRDLVESEDFQNSASKITFAVGRDLSGEVMVTDIAKMPHLLIAGATGSGKSVCINTIIMSILYKAKPDEVKMIMIDPKVVELSVYNGIPHLLIPVVNDPKKAAGALNWAVEEMTRRYQAFAEFHVRDMKGYNARIAAMIEEDAQKQTAVQTEDENAAEQTTVESKPKLEKMPQIVIIVDELADLMMVASKEVEEYICRLAQLARAAGIHLVIATQRPSVNVITGLIKANMPSRIAFAVTSGIDSRTILDMNGAEKLLGKGDMLFDPQGAPKPMRVQGAFVSDEEVQRVVEFITAKNEVCITNAEVLKKIESSQPAGNTTVAIGGGEVEDGGRDPLFVDAAKIIVDKEKASIGMLQRYLKVGFNRAARIMDSLEEAGVVGPEEGTKPRMVLMNMEQLENYLEENG